MWVDSHWLIVLMFQTAQHWCEENMSIMLICSLTLLQTALFDQLMSLDILEQP